MPRKYTIIVLFLTIVLIYSCDKDVSVTPPDMPPPDGVLFINTFPDSFKIFIDGKYRIRITPDSVRWLETGNYLVTLKKDFFIDTTFNVSVEEGKTTQEFIDFTINPKFRGNLSVEANPADVQIFINDSIVAQQTPATIQNLMPGIYKVTLRRTDYEDKVFTITITSSKTSKINASLIDTTIWNYYNTSNSSIPTNNFTALTLDRKNKLWMGSRNGLHTYNGSQWQSFQTGSTPLTHNVVTSIDVGSNNEKWIGTAEGISIADDQTVINGCASISQTCKTGFDTDSINNVSVYKGINDTYYFATPKGLGSYSLDTFPDVWSFTTLPINDVYTVVNRSEFGFLVGSKRSGIAIFDGIDWEYFNRSNADIPTNSISAMAKSQEGIWIGHLGTPGISGGLSLFNGTSFATYRLPASNPVINIIFVDSRNTKWVGTNAGVFVFDDFANKILLDESATGLPLKDVTGICEDIYGNIWISTRENGLFKMKERPF